MNQTVRNKKHANIKETRDTLQTLATALSVTADLPSDDELSEIYRGADSADYHLSRILVTQVRVLNALKVREDAS